MPRFGIENEHTRLMRERELNEIIVTRCGVCQVSVRMRAVRGIAWFKRHLGTTGHKRAVRRSA